MLDAVIQHHRDIIYAAKDRLRTEGNHFDPHTGESPSSILTEHEPLLEALEAAQQLLSPNHPLWMHVKRGTIYHDIGTAMAQCNHEILDGQELKLYRDIESGDWFVRAPDEFLDGRFVPVKPTVADDPEVIQRFTVVLRSNDYDDHSLSMTDASWKELCDRNGRLTLSIEDSDNEDMWGDWRVREVVMEDGRPTRLFIHRA